LAGIVILVYFWFFPSDSTPDPSTNPNPIVKYGDSIFLKNVNNGLFASPCGNLQSMFSETPVSVNTPTTEFQVVGGTTGAQVNFGDHISILFQNHPIYMINDVESDARFFIFVNAEEFQPGQPPSASTWTISNTDKTGQAVKYLDNFDLINANPNLTSFHMASCNVNQSNCVGFAGSTCGNVVVAITDLSLGGNRWLFQPVQT